MADEPQEEESTESRFRRVQEELRAMELLDVPDDEVDAQLAAIQGRGRPSLPDVPLGENALQDIEQRTASARNVHRKAKNEQQSRFEKDGKAARGLGIGLAIAYAMIGLPLVGLGIGYLIQKAVGGPWVATGVVVGFAAGIAFTLYLNARESSRL